MSLSPSESAAPEPLRYSDPLPEPPPEHERAWPPAFGAVYAALAMVGLGNSMMFVVLAPIARRIGLPDIAVVAVYTLSAAFWVGMSPIWGRISDHWGRRRVMLIGIGGFALSMLGVAAIASAAFAGWIIGWGGAFAGLMLARALYGAIGSGGPPAASAYCADMSSRARRTIVISTINSAFALGAAVGPAIAGAIVAWAGLLAPLWAVAALAIVNVAVLARRMPEPSRSRPRAEPAAPFWRFARDPRVLAFMMFGLALSTITAVLTQTSPFLVIDRLALADKAAGEALAVVLGAGAVAIMLAQLVLAPRFSGHPRGLMITGAALMAASALLSSFAGSIGPLALAQALGGVGFGLARSGFTGAASLAVEPHEQGAIAGLISATAGFGFLIAPLLGPGVYALAGPAAPFLAMAGLSAALCAFALASRRIRRYAASRRSEAD